jgi:hypothetical protein
MLSMRTPGQVTGAQLLEGSRSTYDFSLRGGTAFVRTTIKFYGRSAALNPHNAQDEQ